jgi:large subunit ribosomal protein L25
MSDEFVLKVKKRAVVGKKVKQLRQEDQIPAIVYGPGDEPLPIQAERKELRQVLFQAGGTQLIELQVGKEKIPVLAREVQRDVIRGDILHVDFYRVAMDRVIRAEVPVVLVGEPAIVASGTAIITHLLTTVEIEALPADLPPHIEVDISSLEEVGEQITVGDLLLSASLTAITGAEEPVIKLDYARMPEIEEEEEEELLVEEPAPGDVEVIRERKEEEEED